jgi:hypothetical protein
VAVAQQDLKQRIALTQKVLAEVERQRLFTGDPIERPRIEKRIEELQKDLFEDRKRLAALSNEPLRERTSQPGASRSLVFVSYHRADQQWLDRLLAFLKPIQGQGVLDVWDEARIETGSRWREQIETELQAAKVAVLLVSADYLASDFIIDRELPILLEGARDRGVHILPVIVSPCRFERTPLRQFQAVNSPSSPLTSRSEREQDHVFAINGATRSRRL